MRVPPILGRGCCIAAACVLLVSTSTSPAAAQDAEARPGARTFLAQAAGDPVKRATEAFKKGTKLFGEKKYIPALAEFQTSYNLVPSPNSGLYIARCYAELGQHKEAYYQFKRVIGEADTRARTEPKYGPTRDSARNEIEDVSKKLSLLTVQVQNPAANTTLRVGAMPIARDQWGQPIPLDPGGVDVLLDTPGTPPVQNRIELQRGEKKTIAVAPQQPGVNLPPPPPPRKNDDDDLGLLPVALAFGGLGVAGMVTFGVAGGLSLGTYSEVEDTCSTLPAAECNDLIDKGETQQLIANVGWIVGAVGLAAGATILIVDLTGGSSSDTRDASNVQLDVGPGRVGVSGSF